MKCFEGGAGISAFFGVFEDSEIVCGHVCAIDEKTMTNVYTKSMKFDDFELARRYRL